MFNNTISQTAMGMTPEQISNSNVSDQGFLKDFYQGPLQEKEFWVNVSFSKEYTKEYTQDCTRGEDPQTAAARYYLKKIQEQKFEGVIRIYKKLQKN